MVKHSESEITDILKKNSPLSNIPASSMQWLISNSQLHLLEKDSLLFDKGQDVTEMIILLSGKTQTFLLNNGQMQEVGTIEPGEITGLLPYSRLKKVIGRSIALEETQYLKLHKDYFPEMIKEHPQLTEALVHLLTNRVRNFTAQQRQNEKILALGKLSAGLAHELNNPAAAIVRSSSALKKHLGFIPDKFKKVIHLKVSEQQVDLVNGIMHQKIIQSTNTTRTLLEKNQLEDEITDWLEDHGLEDCMLELTETFVAFGMTADDLDLIAENLSDTDLSSVLQWVESNLNTERLVQEIQEASERISGLVNAVKSYTHMDRAPEREPCDLRIGIQNTITILQHKIKQHAIKIIEEYPEDMPKVPVFVNEMNQVWTNLIDNAIDAIKNQEEKTIYIRAFEENGFLKTHFIDNGPGVPLEIQTQIFDPFFTTKAVGEGSGLGLDVVRQIMERHRGKISLQSEPGHTVFEVCLPIQYI